MNRVQVALVALLTLAYPVLVFVGMDYLEPRWLALLLVVLALTRALTARQPVWLFAAAGALLLAVLTVLGNQLLPLKLYPALVNAVLLVFFAASLIWPPSLVERLARLQEPNLPERAVRYTRRVTQVWCGFFVLNGSLALITALWASAAIWALYNGLLAYVLMGLLFAIEWWVRQRLRLQDQQQEPEQAHHG